MITKIDLPTRVIIIDGLPKQSTIIKAYRLGVCDYFPKPVNVALLIERVDALVKKRDTQKQ